MTYQEFSDIISHDVSRILAENAENTLQSLIENIDASHTLTKDHVVICKNAVTASVHLSVQIIFSYLESLGIVNCESLSEYFEPPVLKVVQGGLSQRDSD